MKKKYFACALLAIMLSLSALCGCFMPERSIVSIDKTESIGLVDYYTITYTDGTTSTFTVTNGADGKDGEDGDDAPTLTVDEVYEFYKQTNPDLTKEQFIEKYLTLQDGDTSQDNLTALSSLFRSGMIIYTVFNESAISTTESNFTGSGVLYRVEKDYAYILTNYHMVYDEKAVTADKIFKKAFAYMYGSGYAPVRTTTGELVLADDDNFGLTCEFVGGSAECDVAVLRVPTSELTSRYPYAKAVTINQNYEVGQTVYALGNPNGEGFSLTKGIVSVDLEAVQLTVAGKTRNYYLLRTDADLDHGSSGGGLFNAEGELVALCNAGSEAVSSINYAIPATTVVPCAEGVRHYFASNGDHSTYRMRLGVTVYENNCRYVYNQATESGSIKADITVSQPEAGETNPVEGYPAHTMGLKADDIIKFISINGTKHEINRMIDMTNVLMQVRAGDSVTITLKRGNEEIVSSAYAVKQTDLVSM